MTKEKRERVSESQINATIGQERKEKFLAKLEKDGVSQTDKLIELIDCYIEDDYSEKEKNEKIIRDKNQEILKAQQEIRRREIANKKIKKLEEISTMKKEFIEIVEENWRIREPIIKEQYKRDEFKTKGDWLKLRDVLHLEYIGIKSWSDTRDWVLKKLKS